MRIRKKSCIFAEFLIRYLTMKKILSFIFVLFVCASASVTQAKDFGVPSESEDVMLQAFYWDSYTLTKYGRTKWIDLLKDTAAINDNFDLVWFPPSASSSGGVGYIPAKMDNQDNTAWGQMGKLRTLINGLHRRGTKVIADIVVNHRGNKSSWCDFYEDDFGLYGKFQLTSEHICSNDEGFTNKESNCYGSSVHGAKDSGTDFAGARDLDHTSAYVRKWVKAYLSWMQGNMKYDGFRYDMTLGYSSEYLSEYNESAQPYFTVSEYWEGIDKQVQHLKDANFNTMVFDFPLKYKLHDAINGNALGQLKNPANSLRGKGFAKYAVTFIDNHDTFERSDNQWGEFIKYNADLSQNMVKNKILQANAYILMMPGIPCVFWPHWKSYTAEINEMIAIRKRAGIHSESEVLEESGQGNKYEATIVGHRGTVILRLGAGRSKDVPEGYELAADGDIYNAYSIYIKMKEEGIETVNGERLTVKGEKFMENGQLYILVGEKVFDARGCVVE